MIIIGRQFLSFITLRFLIIEGWCRRKRIRLMRLRPTPLRYRFKTCVRPLFIVTGVGRVQSNVVILLLHKIPFR